MQTLDGKVAIVTGASRGVGKGMARELAERGAKVYVTGRSEQDLRYIEGHGTPICCDHRVDDEVDAAFSRILGEAGRIDILVKQRLGEYERMVEDGEFTWPKPFWEEPFWPWDAMFSAGVRAHYRATQTGKISWRGPFEGVRLHRHGRQQHSRRQSRVLTASPQLYVDWTERRYGPPVSGRSPAHEGAQEVPLGSS